MLLAIWGWGRSELAKSCELIGGWCQRGMSELVQEVLAASGDLARDGQRGTGVGQAAGFERVVVVIVGAGGSGG